MIPYDIDPSLHAAEPEQPMLDDGFSMPRGHGESHEREGEATAASLEDALASKSDF